MFRCPCAVSINLANRGATCLPWVAFCKLLRGSWRLRDAPWISRCLNTSLWLRGYCRRAAVLIPAQSIGWSCQAQELYLLFKLFTVTLIPTVCSSLFLEGDGSTGQSCESHLYEYIFRVSLTLRVGYPLLHSVPLLGSVMGGEQGA